MHLSRQGNYLTGCLLALMTSYVWADPPSWLSEKSPFSKKYSASLFLRAIGEGASLTNATSDAKNQLIQELEVRVQSTLKSQANSSLKSDTQGVSTGADEEKTDSTLSLTSDVTVSGIQIVDTSYDKGSRTYYALAVLNKLKAKTHYLLQLKALSVEMTTMRQKFIKNPTARLFDELKKKDTQFQKINAIYAALSLTGAMPSPIRSEEWEQMSDTLTKQRQRSLFFLNFKGTPQNTQRLLEKCLTEKGTLFTLSPTNGATPLNIEETVTPMYHRVSGWVKYQYILSASFDDGSHRHRQELSAQSEQVGRAKDQCDSKAEPQTVQDLCTQISDITLEKTDPKRSTSDANAVR